MTLFRRLVRFLKALLKARRTHPCLSHVGRPQVGRYEPCPGWSVEPLAAGIWTLWHGPEPVAHTPPRLDYLSRLLYRQRN